MLVIRLAGDPASATNAARLKKAHLTWEERVVSKTTCNDPCGDCDRLALNRINRLYGNMPLSRRASCNSLTPAFSVASGRTDHVAAIDGCWLAEVKFDDPNILIWGQIQATQSHSQHTVPASSTWWPSVNGSSRQPEVPEGKGSA